MTCSGASIHVASSLGGGLIYTPYERRLMLVTLDIQ